MRKASGLVGLLFFQCACGEKEEPVVEIDAAAATAIDAALTDAADLAACAEGAIRLCGCSSGGSGMQRCGAGVYGACEGCTTVAVNRCVAGNYIGEARGKALSTAAGLPPFTTLAEADAFGEWQFSLQASGNQEFYTVGDGCISFSDAATQNTVGAKLYVTGNVDCATGELRGEIRGFYSSASLLNFSPQNFYFKGTILGKFNPETMSFDLGTYEYKEPKLLLGSPPGGSGMWSAKLTDEPVSTQGQEGCLGGPFPEEKF